MGSVQNFWKQHKLGVSKACKDNFKKSEKAATHQRSQPRIQAFFIKPPNPHVPPTVTIPSYVIAYTVKLGSSGPYIMPVVSTVALSMPNICTISILVMLENATRALSALPKASETNKIAIFS